MKEIYKLIDLFLKHPKQKVLLLSGVLPLDFQSALSQDFNQQDIRVFFINSAQPVQAENALKEIPFDSPALFIFKVTELENLYMRYNLERWQAKVLIISDPRLLHRTMNCSLYFAPIKNGKPQKHLFSQVKMPDLLSTSKIIVNSIEAISKETLKVIVNRSSDSTNHFLNKKIMTTDTVMMQMLADRVQQDETFKTFLFTLVFASRDDEQMQVAAANAITGLNYARVSFSGLDFRNVRIRYADLESANLDNVNLHGADLRDVNFQNAWLRQTDLSESNMHGVKFGEKPHFEFPKGAIAYFPYLNDDLLSVYVNKEENILTVFDARHSNKLCEIKLPGGSELSGYRDIAISRERPLLACLTRKHSVIVAAWDTKGQSKLSEIELSSELYFSRIFLSEDGLKLALIHSVSESTQGIQIWNVETKKMVYKLETDSFVNGEFNSDLSRFVFFTSDGIVYSCNSSNEIAPSILSQCNWKNENDLKFSGGTSATGTKKDGFKVSEKSILSQSCKLLFRCNQNGAEIWLLNNGQLLWSAEICASYAAFSPNDKYLAIAFGKSVTLVDIELAKAIMQFDANPEEIIFLMFSLDEKQLICSTQSGIGKIWNINYEDSCRNNVLEKKKRVDKVLFSPDGRILAIARWGVLDLLLVETWQVIQSFEVDKWQIVDMAFSPNNKYLAVLGKLTSTATLFDISAFPKIVRHPHKFGGNFHLINKENSDSIITLEIYQKEHFEKMSNVDLSDIDVELSDKDFEGLENFNNIKITQQKLFFFMWLKSIHQKYLSANFFLGYEVKSIAVSNDKLIIGNSDGSYHVCSIEKPGSFFCIGYTDNSCGDVSFMIPETDSDRLYMCSAFTSFTPDNIKTPCKLAFSNEAKYFAITRPDRIKLINNDVLNAPNLDCNSFPMNFLASGGKYDVELAISSSSEYFAVIQGRTLFLWSKNSPQKYIEFSMDSDQDKITCVSFSSDNRYLAFGCTDDSRDNRIYLWNTVLKSFSGIIQGINGAIRNISWMKRDSKLFLTTSSADDVVRCWEVIGNSSHVNFVLRWSDGQYALVAQDTCITNVDGIDSESEKILILHGATRNFFSESVQQTGNYSGRLSFFRTDKFSSEQQVYKVIGSPVEFSRHATDPNGDCGYTAFGITRDNALSLLMQRLVEVRSLLRPVVKELLLQENFIRYLQQQVAAPTSLLSDFAAYQNATGEASNRTMQQVQRFADDLVILQGYLNYV